MWATLLRCPSCPQPLCRTGRSCLGATLRAPQPLDEYVVHPAPAAVHRDAYAGGCQRAGEGGAGELAALVGVEDVRLAEARQGLLQRRDAERAVHGVGQPPGEHRPARPIHDRHEIKEAAADRDVGDVRAPDLVRSIDGETAQEVRVYLVLGRRPAQAWLRAERGNVRPQQCRHSPRAEEWPGGEQLVDPPHQHEIVVIGGRGRSVQARSCNAEQSALPADRHRAVVAVDEPTAVRGAHLRTSWLKNRVPR
jgi:hypothetical protein